MRIKFTMCVFVGWGEGWGWMVKQSMHILIFKVIHLDKSVFFHSIHNGVSWNRQKMARWLRRRHRCVYNRRYHRRLDNDACISYSCGICYGEWLKTESCQDASFVVTVDTARCPYNNPRCRLALWRRWLFSGWKSMTQFLCFDRVSIYPIKWAHGFVVLVVLY